MEIQKISYSKNEFDFYKKIKEDINFNKNIDALEHLYQLFDIKERCKYCNRPIFYYDTKFNVSLKKQIIRLSIIGKTHKTLKKKYSLCVCEKCLSIQFPSYQLKNKSRVFNRMCEETKYAFNIPNDIYEKEKNKFVVRSKENFINKFGKKEGINRWNIYREKQAITNSFDYKHKKYGMSIEQFNEYNKSRAVTLELMIKRYGRQEGLIRYNNYCEKQKLTSPFGYSKSSQDYFNLLDLELEKNDIDIHNTKFASKNSEERLIMNNDKVYYLDYYIPEHKISIEYYGNYWHMNPDMCNSDDYNKHCCAYAKDIWEFDKKRILHIYEETGIVTFIIWENKAMITIKEFARMIKEYITNLKIKEIEYQKF